MTSVESTIEQIERFYRSVTGTEPPKPNGPYAAIPPEKDPALHVEEGLTKLEALVAQWAMSGVTGAPQTWVPAIDACEIDGECLITCDLPGVDRSQLKVMIGDRVITISGERMTRQSATRLHRKERGFGRFARQILFGAKGRPDQATARFQDGVLEIRVPLGAKGGVEEREIQIQ